MIRKATEADLDTLAAIRCAAFGGTRQQSLRWLRDIAGVENIVMVLSGGEPAAMLCALPLQLGAKRGVLLCSITVLPAWRGSELIAKVLNGCLQAYTASGYSFAVTVPPSAAAAKAFGTLGFQNAFALRLIEKTIPQNLWAQAEFDQMTVRTMLQNRAHYQPRCVTLPEHSTLHMMEELYRGGATLISNPRGYGLYFVKKGNLQFVELQADNDHSADILLQAAREKTGAEKACLLLAENQPLYLGEGKRRNYAMLRFLAQPFPVTDAYFRLLLGE